jgi:hypothetical protein
MLAEFDCLPGLTGLEQARPGIIPGVELAPAPGERLQSVQ